MKKEKALAALLLAALLISGCVQNPGPETAEVCFESACVRAEVADTPEERSTGLMFREELGEGEGMLFVFGSEGLHSFWMKNTRISLDIIWISSGLEVVHIECAEPCTEEPCASYVPGSPALYVLEVSRGFAEGNGIRPGDRVNIPGIKL